MSHIIRNATPKRKSILLAHQSNNEDTESISNLLEVNKVGRPKKYLANVKRKLAYTKSPCAFWKSKKSMSEKFSTFKKMVPKYYKRLDMTCRRVCVCTKDYNFEQKVEALNRVSAQKSMPKLKATPRLLSDLSLCPFDDIPRRTCVDRQCQHCGTEAVHKLYQPLVESYADLTVKYHQWESVPESYVAKDSTKKKTSRWIQTEKKVCVGDLVNDVSDSLVIYTSHLFRACYQYKMESSLMANLPLDHCVVVMDFSENISLQPQDEIESAHWTIKQVTLHPIFIVRHAANSTLDKPIIFKESLVIVSDDIKHSVDAVYAFTHQLIAHIRNNPGPCPMRVLHRFSDNCAAQYKCKDAFSHISLIEKAHDIKVVYHYSESGHGKGPSDGIGAGIKKKLENLILGGKVVNNAYQTYLALTQNPNAPMNQRVIFVPRKIIASLKPKKPKTAKTIKGTQSFHMIATHSKDPDVLTCSDLSCSCTVCICSDQQGPCFFGQFRNDRKHFHLPTGKAVRHTEQNNDELQLFETSIARKGWRIRGTTPSDGNCFFWAVSDQLDLNRMEVHTHTDLRLQLVHFIEKLPEDCTRRLCGCTFQDEEEHMPVLEDVEDEFLLKFLRATRSDGVYNWPVKDDVSWQRSEDIIGRLPAPTLLPCRGIKLMFDLSSLRPLSAYVLK
ncbi:hypothetical protein MAR_017914 [Mya arenaria]|uniref:Ubiquitinyl hydrolase 1 n=1 Tax=Mya arenaria TaxID=6604 RepID=A0ABY7EGM6_MYAAR|nr:hypothetical protein MAR_017914 [Mya arenaria]